MHSIWPHLAKVRQPSVNPIINLGPLSILRAGWRRVSRHSGRADQEASALSGEDLEGGGSDLEGVRLSGFVRGRLAGECGRRRDEEDSGESDRYDSWKQLSGASMASSEPPWPWCFSVSAPSLLLCVSIAKLEMARGSSVDLLGFGFKAWEVGFFSGLVSSVLCSCHFCSLFVFFRVRSKWSQEHLLLQALCSEFSNFELLVRVLVFVALSWFSWHYPSFPKLDFHCSCISFLDHSLLSFCHYSSILLVGFIDIDKVGFCGFYCYAELFEAHLFDIV